MQIDILTSIGLTQNEAKIYLSLLKLGSGTITEIAKESGIHRVNVYDSIEKLKEKNLVSELEKEKNKTIFQSSPPSFLMNLLKDKEVQLQSILSQLELCHHLSSKEVSVQIYRGYDFFRNTFLRYLEKNKPIYSYGIPNFVLDQMSTHGMDGYFFQEQIHKQRAQQKQVMYHIYNSDAIDRVKFLLTLPYTEARVLPQEYDQNVVTLICDDEVNFGIFFSNKEKPMAISIRGEIFSKAFEKYFFLLWEKAVEPITFESNKFKDKLKSKD